MAKVELKNIKKIYTDHAIIEDANIQIADGEFIVIVGPSGCGKSTLLRMIAGLEAITSGTLIIGDRIVNDLEPKDRDIAMVFQNYALYPHMTVFGNMAYGLKMRKKYSKAQIKERVEKAAKMLELTDLLQRRPNQLSGGQRQRVAMGRALVRNPSVFLFDEPLSNLDAKLRVQMRLEIKKLHNNVKTTSIYVTHDQMEAMTLADRLVVINKGVIEQIGLPLEVYRKPATIFVAGFIGSPAMNFLSAKISSDGKLAEVYNQVKFPITLTVPKKYHGKIITLGIRPENIIPPTQDSDESFTLNIDLVEPLGADNLVYGHISGSKHLLAARLPGKWHYDNQKQIEVTVRKDSLHLFEIESGKRIYAES